MFMLVCFDLKLSLLPLEVDLVLLCPNEGSFVDIGMHFNVGVVAELQSVLQVPSFRSANQKAESGARDNVPTCYSLPS